MKILKDNEFKTFEHIVQLPQTSLLMLLYKVLKSKYKKVEANSYYICAEGDIPIALVAHLDTVFSDPPKEVFYDKSKGVIWSPTGLGADDRAGVFAILQILKSGLRPHVIFTTDEEIGGVGASALAAKAAPFGDIRYIIELDRRGTNDCVFYDCYNEDFINYVESFGFTEAYGTFSDISMICPEWRAAGVNLSIGYRDEHSSSEVLFVAPMLATIEKVKKMLSAEEIPSFEYIDGYVNEAYFDYSKFFSMKRLKCAICNYSDIEENLIPVHMLDGHIDYMCPDCIIDNVEWCEDCGEAYQKPVGQEYKKFRCNECNHIKK